MSGRFEAVPVGSVVFALIDPSPGREADFDRWYGLDHFYTAGMAAPGVFSGSRFLASASCRSLRRPDDAAIAGDPARGTHLALWFVMAGHDGDRVAWATDQMAIAAAEDRLFADREHLHTWSYEPVWVWVDGTRGVDPALVLDRRFDGLSVVLVDLPDGVDDTAFEAAARSAWRDRADPVVDVLVLRPGYEIMPSSWIGPVEPARRRALLCFHDGDVAEGWTAARRRLDPLVDDGLATVAWASPFVVRVFGTTDQLDQR